MITGGCLCKAVRYRATAQPITTRTCWCRVCQYFGAGNATVNAFFTKDAVAIEGQLKDFRSVADSGNMMHRKFCPSCGTHLFSEAEPRPHLISIRVGTLDNPEVVTPSVIMWTARAPSWACIDQRIPKNEGQPPPAA